MSEYKKVRIKMTVEYDVEVPADWDQEMIEFHRNESSWCANSAIKELQEVFDSPDSKECLCRAAEFEYVYDVGSPYLK